MERDAFDHIRRYGLAVVLVLVPLLARPHIEALIGFPTPIIVFVPSVLLSLFLCGLWPGMLATALSVVVEVYLMLSTDGRISTGEGIRLGAFVISCLIASRLLAGREDRISVEHDSLAHAMANAVQGISMIDNGSRFTWANNAAAALLGRQQDRLQGVPLMELVAVEDHPRVLRAIAESNRKGRAETEVRMLWHSTAPVDMNLILVRHTAATGSPDGHYLFIRDVGRRKKEEEQLRESEQRFRLAFLHSETGMGIANLEGYWIEANPVLCQLVGYTAQELTTRRFDAITHPDDVAEDVELTRKLYYGEIDHYHLHKRYIHKNGHAVPVSLMKMIVRDANNRPLHYLTQVQPITPEHAHAVFPVVSSQSAA